MKYLLALIFISSSIYSSQLEGQKFVDTENTWIVTTSWWTGHGGNFDGYIRAFRFQDSTLINGRFYYQLYSATSINSHNYASTGNLYRQENDSIFIVGGMEEMLIMDESMQIGDSFIGFGHSDELTVINIDSVIMADGSFRKRFEFDGPYNDAPFWIQGIGFNNGFDYYHTATDSGRPIQCYYKEDEFQYMPSRYGACSEVIDRYQGKFVNPDNRWYTFEGSAFPNGYVNNYWYRFQDTVIREGKTYMKLFRSENDPYSNYEDRESYWREDAEGRVYRYDPFKEDGEKLEYDFSLEVGDSIEYFNSVIHITEVDTVQMENGDLRKRLTITNSSGQEVEFVEGIGANLGTFSSVYWITDIFHDLYCFYEGNGLSYSTEGNEGRCITLDLEESITLNGEMNNSKVELNWTHESKDDIIYNIEWSIDVENWEDIGDIDGLSNSHFQFTDTDPSEGINYYRVFGINSSDEKIYSNIISVKYSPDSEITIYPNPTNGELNFSGIKSGTYRIYDTVGKVYLNGNIKKDPIDVSGLAAGIYFIEIKDDGSNIYIVEKVNIY